MVTFMNMVKSTRPLLTSWMSRYRATLSVVLMCGHSVRTIASVCTTPTAALTPVNIGSL